MGLAEECEIADGAGVDEVEARLVAVDEVEFGGGGEVAEGGGEAIELCVRFEAFHLLIEHAGFDGEGAAQAPVGGDHLFDEPELDFVDGAEAVDVGIDQCLEDGAALIAEEHALGEQAVAHGVA